MLHFLLNLPNVWTNTHCIQNFAFYIGSNFEYAPITNNKHDNIPNFILGTELNPILDLELVLVMDTPELILLDDLLELLSNQVKDQSLFTLDGTFSALGDQFESDFFPTQEFLNIPIEFSGNGQPDKRHAYLILTFNRSHILDPKVCHQHINQLKELPPSSWLVLTHLNKCQYC